MNSVPTLRRNGCGTFAARGHCEAARMARQMVRLGRAHYGVDFAVAPLRLEHWQRLPGCALAATGRR
jgi:hypothetical protein